MVKLIVESNNGQHHIITQDNDVVLDVVLSLLQQVKNTKTKTALKREIAASEVEGWKARTKNAFNMPSTKTIREFILEQPNFRHDMGKLGLHFLGHIPSINKTPESRTEYNTLWTKITRARSLIAKNRRGIWKKEKFGRKSEYSFLPHNPI